MINTHKIQIKDVKELLASGKKIQIKTKNGKFFPIVNYFEKGKLPTYKVITEGGYEIKTSANHNFFTSQGWASTNELKPTITKIYCEDDAYHTVESVSYIGDHNIVDVEVDSEEHSYFGNGMLNHNSGKSLLSAHALAETQKMGGVAVLIDTETAVSREFFDAIGVDVSKLLYVSVDTVEDIFETMETIIEKVRVSDKNRLVTIVVDSVAAASTKKEMEADYDQDGYATTKAIIISKAMRKITNEIGRQRIAVIFTNQLRQKLNAPLFSDPWCVDPVTTKIKIRYKIDSKYIEEEISLLEFAERFANVDDFVNPEIYDLENAGIEVLTLDESGKEVYRPIKSFVVKETVTHYYTDGKIKVSANHRFIENGETIFAKDHPEFIRVEEPLPICDIEVEDLHSYLANGRLNHNTTSGGKALAFHSSIRLRLKNMGQIKDSSKTRILGIKVRAQVIKNRLGPPLRSADFDIYFDRGIDNYGSWLTVLKDHSLINQKGAWYEYLDTSTGEIVRFQSKDWIQMMTNNTELRDQIYKKICEETILQYKKDTTDIDSMQVESDGISEFD